MLTSVDTERGRVRVIRIDPNVQTTKDVMGCPLTMPLTSRIVKSLPDTPNEREFRQVIVAFRGSLPPSLTLGNWGTFYMWPNSPEPLRPRASTLFQVPEIRPQSGFLLAASDVWHLQRRAGDPSVPEQVPGKRGGSSHMPQLPQSSPRLEPALSGSPPAGKPWSGGVVQ